MGICSKRNKKVRQGGIKQMKNKLDTKKYALEILETINCGIGNSWFDDAIDGHLSEEQIEEVETNLIDYVDIILKNIKWYMEELNK